MIEPPTISRPTTEDIPRPTASQYSADEARCFPEITAQFTCEVCGMSDQSSRIRRLEDVVQRLEEESKNRIQDRQRYDEDRQRNDEDRQRYDEKIRKLKALSDEDAEIWAGPIIKKVANEIILRIAKKQPKEQPASNIFSKFAAENPEDFQMLSRLFGQGRDTQKYAQFLDSLVLARNAAINCKVNELDEQVAMLLRLNRRHPTISAMFFDQWTFILKYDRLKGLFPDRFVIL